MMDFVLRAMLAGIAVATVAGPLGCMVVWRRMAYFGDALSHSALLGIVLGLFVGLQQDLSVIAVCSGMALLLVWLQSKKQHATDTLLGILSHSLLALGMVALAFLQGLRIDLMSYLFGDILAVTWDQVTMMYLSVAGVGLVLCLLWRQLLAMTVHAELAEVEGVKVVWVNALFMLLMTVVVALAMKVVGVLLITALLIIPAATAQRFAKNPEQMALFASLIGILSVILGCQLSLQIDIPTGPAIVVVATSLFFVSVLLGRNDS